jgi:hypothetical protein
MWSRNQRGFFICKNLSPASLAMIRSGQILAEDIRNGLGRRGRQETSFRTTPPLKIVAGSAGELTAPCPHRESKNYGLNEDLAYQTFWPDTRF